MSAQQEKYYGLYPGFVRDNADPERLGRLKIHVPTIHDEIATADLPWALYQSPFGGGAGYGMYMVPDVGAQVAVQFLQGHHWYPVWTGTLAGRGDTLSEVGAKAPAVAHRVREIKTTSGHRITFDDDAGTVQIVSSAGHSITLDDGSGAEKVTISSQGGHEIVLDDTSGTENITMTTSGGHEVLMDDTAAAPVLSMTSTAGHKVSIDDLTGITTLQDAAGLNWLRLNALTGGAEVVGSATALLKAPIVTVQGTIVLLPA